jgi:hypothetical protein
MPPSFALMAGLLLTASPAVAHGEDARSGLPDVPRDQRVHLNPPEDRFLLLRIGSETAAGALAGVGGAIAGIYVTAWAYCTFGGMNQCGQAGLNIFSMAAGAVVATTLAEWGVGTLLGGSGGLLPTLAGAILGAAIAIPFGPLGLLALVLVPVGATVGYEVSNHFARRARLPAVALFPVQGGGGGLALAWRI